ncbi:MAG TPA: ClbS/DfsB family four-helix bundle protein [Anaerolineales bacterium]|jgi:hypothetical protein
MGQREELLAILENSRAKMIKQLNEVDLKREIYPLWTIREMLAHLAGWDEVVIGYARSLMAEQTPATPAAPGIDAYNAESVAARASLNYDQVRDEFIGNREILMNLLQEIREEHITARHILPWGSKGNLVDIVNIWGPHEEEHAEDVEKLISHSQ